MGLTLEELEAEAQKGEMLPARVEMFNVMVAKDVAKELFNVMVANSSHNSVVMVANSGHNSVTSGGDISTGPESNTYSQTSR